MWLPFTSLIVKICCIHEAASEEAPRSGAVVLMCCAAVEVLFVLFVFHSQDRNLESFALLQHFAVMTEVVGGREQLRKLDEHLLTRE